MRIPGSICSTAMAEPMPLSDEALVRAMIAGDEAAVGRVYDRHGGLLYSLALRILGTRSEAEEVVQDVFLKLWQNADRFDRSRGSLTGFLVTMTRNRAIDRLRSLRGTTSVTGSDLDGLPHPDWSPLEAAGLEEARRRVRRALPALPEAEREVLRLAYFEGLSQSQIADRIDAPLGTVKGRARNGMRRLREALAETGKSPAAGERPSGGSG
jgi:RNA polymerase sigma-70 factor (ECF subfamily)